MKVETGALVGICRCSKQRTLAAYQRFGEHSSTSSRPHPVLRLSLWELKLVRVANFGATCFFFVVDLTETWNQIQSMIWWEKRNSDFPYAERIRALVVTLSAKQRVMTAVANLFAGLAVRVVTDPARGDHVVLLVVVPTSVQTAENHPCARFVRKISFAGVKHVVAMSIVAHSTSRFVLVEEKRASVSFPDSVELAWKMRNNLVRAESQGWLSSRKMNAAVVGVVVVVAVAVFLAAVVENLEKKKNHQIVAQIVHLRVHVAAVPVETMIALVVVVAVHSDRAKVAPSSAASVTLFLRVSCAIVVAPKEAAAIVHRPINRHRYGFQATHHPDWKCCCRGASLVEKRHVQQKWQ